MTDCDRTVEWLLEAALGSDRSGPRGARASDAGRHMAVCEDCRAKSETLSRGTERMVRRLERQAPPFDADTAVRIARGMTGAKRPDAPVRLPGLRSRWAHVRRRGLSVATARWVPVAAAAVALFLVARGPGDPGSTVDDWPPAPEPVGPFSLSVEAPAEGRLAVFHTGDPKIHVVWLY